MTEERMKVALERTRKHMVRHLEDLNDEIDQANGRIENHMVVDGLKDCVKTLCRIKELLGGSGGSQEESEDSETARNVSPLR